MDAAAKPPWVRALCLRSTASQAPERTAASGWAGLGFTASPPSPPARPSPPIQPGFPRPTQPNSRHEALRRWLKIHVTAYKETDFCRNGYHDRLTSHRSHPLMRRKIVAGNWKLHGSRQFANELLGQVAAGLPLEGGRGDPAAAALPGSWSRTSARPAWPSARRTSAATRRAPTPARSARPCWSRLGPATAWSAIPSAASTTMRAASWSRAVRRRPARRPGAGAVRGRDPGTARGRADRSGHRQPAGAGAGAGRRGRFRQCCGRLRAGLGHRYRPYRQQGTGTAGARVHPWRSRAHRC